MTASRIDGCRTPGAVLALAAATALALLLGLSVAPPARADEPVTTGYTTTDNGDGTYGVPLLNSDVPDVGVERLAADDPTNDTGRDVYYMVSTTMHLAPGAPIMRSFDLVNWETVNYVFDRIDVTDPVSLRNGASSYGQGQWASSLRYHQGTWYVLFNTNNLGGAYLYRTTDIEDGVWSRTALGRGLHDPSLFFDEAAGGTPYIFHGAGVTNVAQLDEGLTRIVAEFSNVMSKADFPDQPYVTSAYEGQQVYRIGDYYYNVSITWPSGGGRQVVIFRSPELLGRYTAADGAQTWEARSALNSDGFAQGSLVPISRADGGTDWWGMFFRDTYPLGRIPGLIPATWTDGWPTFGNDGVVRLGDTFPAPIELSPAEAELARLTSIVASDDFANDAEHRAYSDVEWTLPEHPEFDESLLGVELVANGGFESGSVSPWVAQYGATLTLDTGDPASGTTALAVTDRTRNGSAPRQAIDGGRMQPGATYTVSARIKYTSGPDTIRFNLATEYTNSAGVKIMAGTTVPRGEWTTVTGTYTVPADADTTSFRIVVETPWANPQPASASVSYLLDDVSVVGQPVTAEYAHPDEVGYNGSDLDLAWEWNHAPDNRYWSLTERPGWLRLTNGSVVTGEYDYRKGTRDDLTWLEEARNTLSQRTFGPTSSAQTTLDVTHLSDGDVAGLAVYARSFTYAAVRNVDGVFTLGLVERLQPFDARIDHAAVEAFQPDSVVELGADRVVSIKADADFTTTGRLFVQYHYSLDGRTWQPLGEPTGPLVMDWSLSHFMGYRFGLFSYATEASGGYVDIDSYLLSDTLTSSGVPVTTVELDAAIARAQALDESDYPAQEWAGLRSALDAAVAARDAGVHTHNEADAPTLALRIELARLAVFDEQRPALAVSATAEARCVAGRVVLAVTVVNADDVPVQVRTATAHGTRTATVQPGRQVFQSISTRRSTVPDGAASVTATASVGGDEVATEVIAAYPGRTC